MHTIMKTFNKLDQQTVNVMTKPPHTHVHDVYGVSRYPNFITYCWGVYCCVLSSDIQVSFCTCKYGCGWCFVISYFNHCISSFIVFFIVFYLFVFTSTHCLHYTLFNGLYKGFRASHSPSHPLPHSPPCSLATYV